MLRITPALAAFVLGLTSRLVLIAGWPGNYSFDAFQRWGGRDHLLVQSWLPATQSVIYAVAGLGGDVLAARIAMALIAAAAAAAGALLAERLGGRPAGWAFLVPASYGPFLVWGSALYQEGTFLLVLFAGLALALSGPAGSESSGRLRAADVVIGALGLVRYEGWPCVALYVLWRRDPRALVAAWGIGVWTLLHGVLTLPGHAPSPVDIDDWVGLGERARLSTWLHDAWRLLRVGFGSGGVTYGFAAIVGIALSWRERGARLVVALALLQVAAVAGWLIGLEIAMARMLVVPVMLAGILSAAGAGKVWNKLPEGMRPAFFLVGAILVTVGHLDARESLRAEHDRILPESRLLLRIDAPPECEWVITPRTGLGPQNRHDGCEVLQGLSARRHGDGFWCASWGAPGEAGAEGATCVRTATWSGQEYAVSRPAPVRPGQ